MPRVSQPKKGRHPHPDYLYGYVFERDGVWHTSVHSSRRSTGLPAKRQHLMQAMDILSERINEYKRSGGSGQTVVKQAPVTTHTAMQEFLLQKKQTIAPDTLKKYVRNFATNLPVPQLLSDYHAIRAGIVERIAAKKWGTEYVNKILHQLREYFEYCVTAGLCEINPLAAVKPPNPVKKIPLLILPEEVSAIAQFFRSGKWYERFPYEREMNALYVEFLSLSAIRPGESFKLTRNDISNDGIKVDGKRSHYLQENFRYIPFSVIPGLKEKTDEILNLSRTDRLFIWNNSQKPASNFRDAVRALGFNQKYRIYSLRAFAKNWWEKELLIPFDVSNLLAGHSFTVRAKYVRPPTMEDMMQYVRRVEYVRNSSPNPFASK